MSKTVEAVIDGKLTNEQLGGYTRRTNELLRRINEGTLNFDWAMDQLQLVVEGHPLGDGTQFPTWRTVNLGTHKTVDELKTAVKAAGHNISDWANDILGKPAFTISKEAKSELELVKLSVAELGFKNGATRKDIYARAIELGLALCPNEVGPQLRLKYDGQPKGEWILVAMEPISDSDGDPNVFHVKRDDDGKSWLYASYDYPDHVWDGSYVWVFARRK